MKAILCYGCMDIRALDPDKKPVTCRCGNVTARWDEPYAGTVIAMAKDPSLARILGMNNSFLLQGSEMKAGRFYDQKWRELHEATSGSAPGYIFNHDMRNCWACIVHIGETNDTRWGDENDFPVS